MYGWAASLTSLAAVLFIAPGGGSAPVFARGVARIYRSNSSRDSPANDSYEDGNELTEEVSVSETTAMASVCSENNMVGRVQGTHIIWPICPIFLCVRRMTLTCWPRLRFFGMVPGSCDNISNLIGSESKIRN